MYSDLVLPVEVVSLILFLKHRNLNLLNIARMGSGLIQTIQKSNPQWWCSEIMLAARSLKVLQLQSRTRMIITLIKERPSEIQKERQALLLALKKMNRMRQLHNSLVMNSEISFSLEEILERFKSSRLLHQGSSASKTLWTSCQRQGYPSTPHLSIRLISRSVSSTVGQKSCRVLLLDRKSNL